MRGTSVLYCWKRVIFIKRCQPALSLEGGSISGWEDGLYWCPQSYRARILRGRVQKEEAGPQAKALEGCQISSFTLLKGTEFGGAVIGREGAHHGAVKSLQRGFFPAAVRTERATLLVRRDRLLVPRSSVRLKFTGAAEVETHLFS